ncbi:unnamed protein product [Calypogeia fissa]
MAVFTFIAKESGGSWTAKQFGGEQSLEETAASTFELQRKLVNLAIQTAGPNTVSSSFSYTTPKSAVAQVILGGGGGGGGGFVAGGGGGGAASAAAKEEEAPAKEEVKEEEESDGDIGFSLFDD